MRGNDKVLKYLSEALKAELTAINQYFLHGAQERSVFRKYDMATVLTNLPTIVENAHFSEFIAEDAIRTARLFISQHFVSALHW